MSKTFTYTRQCGPSQYSEELDEEFYDTEDFEYEVDTEELRDALSELIFRDYFQKVPGIKENKDVAKEIKGSIYCFIWDNDFEDDLSDAYEDDLKDYFQEDAFNSLDY